jgi:hypothetical protein
MAKIGKRVCSDWCIGTHTVNSYKIRVGDPAVRRKRRTSQEIRTVISRALNKAKNQGKNVDIRSEEYKGKDKIKQLYKIELFKSNYYALASGNMVISLFTSDMVENDAKTGGLSFLDGDPFEELKTHYDRMVF